MTEMNVTNLLDTAFVLLMAFMIVAPSIKHGLKLDLPEAAGTTLEPGKSFTVGIEPNAGGEGEPKVIADGKRIEITELTPLLRERKQDTPDLDVTLEIDRSVTYDYVMKIISAVKAAGVEVIDLPTEQPSDAKD